MRIKMAPLHREFQVSFLFVVAELKRPNIAVNDSILSQKVTCCTQTRHGLSIELRVTRNDNK